MSRTRIQIATSLFGLAVLAAAVPGLRLRGEPKVLQRAGGVTLERVDEALVPHGTRLGARDGDLLLDDGDLVIVVGASTRGGRKQDYGALLDVAGPGLADDALGAMRRALEVDGRRVAVVTERVDALPAKVAPFLRIIERDPAGTLELSTDLVVRKHQPTVEILTTVTNHGSRPSTVRLGDDIDWSGVPTFAPGHGEVEESGKKSVAWFGRRGALTYGLVFPAELADVEFRAKQSDTDQTAWTKAFELAPGASRLHRRVLVAGRRGLSEIARTAAKLRGDPIGSVTGVLEPAPSWALLTAVASDGTIAIKEGAREDGSFDLALSPGRYVLVLQTPGGWDETSVEVRAGATTQAHLVAPQPERLDFRFTDPEGRPIPGRMIVTGEGGTPDPRFTSAPRVSAAGNEVHSVTGEGRLDIPAGRYRVVVTRGIEWSVVERIIDVKSEQGVALRAVLAPTLPTPGWISADLHLHAAPSGDSELPLDDRVAALVAAGVEFAVATDHNHVTDYSPVVEAAGAHQILATVPGVEVTTRTWGHFNAYPMPARSPAPPSAGIEPPEMFAAVRRMSPKGVIQVNHPWNPGYGYFRRAALNERTGAVWRKHFSFDFDLIEVINGYELGTSDVFDKNLHRYWDLLNLGHHYGAVGSSDSHKLTSEWAGYPRTYVRVPDDRPDRVSVADVVDALRAGHAIVSLGPFIEAHIGDSGPGDTVSTVAGTLPLDITVRSSPWIQVNRVDVVIDGEIHDTFSVEGTGPGDSVRWAQVVDVPATRDSWVVVVARGDRPIDAVLPGLHVPPFAFTNPIWIDVGEPRPPAPRQAVRRAPRKEEVLIDPPAPVDVDSGPAGDGAPAPIEDASPPTDATE